jgi:hypothetical protein
VELTCESSSLELLGVDDASQRVPRDPLGEIDCDGRA